VSRALNEARSPFAVVAFILGGLLSLAAIVLGCIGLVMYFGDLDKQRTHEMKLAIVNKPRPDCDGSNSTFSHTVNGVNYEASVLNHVLPPPASDECPAWCSAHDSPPTPSDTCCHVLPRNASSYSSAVVDDARRCVDDRLKTEWAGPEHSRSNMTTGAAMSKSDHDDSGSVEGYEIVEAVIIAMPASAAADIVAVRLVRRYLWCPA